MISDLQRAPNQGLSEEYLGMLEKSRKYMKRVENIFAEFRHMYGNRNVTNQRSKKNTSNVTVYKNICLDNLTVTNLIKVLNF